MPAISNAGFSMRIVEPPEESRLADLLSVRSAHTLLRTACLVYTAVEHPTIVDYNTRKELLCATHYTPHIYRSTASTTVPPSDSFQRDACTTIAVFYAYTGPNRTYVVD